ncbi:MAG: NADH-quinone oxidoreductase subunit L [Parachlamydiaceae bacterium]|nr:NADH-quinone oxidoreductase subunit L [Parachlamydiaceae bacterium]
METLVYIGLFTPLVSFLILMFSAMNITRFWTKLIGCSSILISLICFTSILWLFSYHQMPDQNFILFNWIPIEGIDAKFHLHIDSLAILMTLIITGVGFLIHVYSIGYMEHDEDIPRYFACMNFFVFSMLLLVLAGHLLLLFVGWEGVGLASYLLIGFWYERPTAAQAATKAFVMNRIGDLGFLMGLLLTFHLFGTGDIEEINLKAGSLFTTGVPILSLMTLLYFVGATGKSAQIPLHTWLPDAMEGPTPVSALIHAATMVTAGVYLIVRMHPVFLLTPETLKIIGIIGAVTSLFASLWALGQTDLKKVLANSTVSQLGLMFVACGAGAFYSAMFHLTTHAFMKSLLFLSAGNVVHRLDGSTDMQKMGGLRNKMPFTNWVFLIGVLAMSGIPPLAAFFSKDMILEQEYMAGFESLFYLSLGASILTGVYLIRAYCITFLGDSRMDKDAYAYLREAPKIMVYPLLVLSFLSVFGGGLGFSFHKVPVLAAFLQEIGLNPYEKKLSTDFILSYETLLAIGGAILGVAISFIIYSRHYLQLGPTLQGLKNSFYFDELYNRLFVSPLKILSKWIVQIFEPKIFNGMIDGVLIGINKIAIFFQRLQSGQIRSYISWMAMGLVFLLGFYIYFTKGF